MTKDISERRATDDLDAELSATNGWFQCWCGCEWWISAGENADVPLHETCDRCEDAESRHAMHAMALHA